MFIHVLWLKEVQKVLLRPVTTKKSYFKNCFVSEQKLPKDFDAAAIMREIADLRKKVKDQDERISELEGKVAAFTEVSDPDTSTNVDDGRDGDANDD